MVTKCHTILRCRVAMTELKLGQVVNDASHLRNTEIYEKCSQYTLQCVLWLLDSFVVLGGNDTPCHAVCRRRLGRCAQVAVAPLRGFVRKEWRVVL